MISNRDDLEEVLLQNLKLRRELGAQVAKARDSSAKPMADVPVPPQNRPSKLTTAGTGPRAIFWVSIGSLSLAMIAGLALGFAFGWIPLPWNFMP